MRARTWVVTALRHMGADGAILIGATCALGAVIAHFGGRLELAGGSLVAPLPVFLPIVAFCAFLRRRDGAWRALVRSLRDWAPFFLLNVLYCNLQSATGFLPARNVERALLETDQRIFGIEPSVWIQRFTSPLLSDYMAFSYGLMFIMPFVVLALLYRRGRRAEFRECLIALLLTSYAGFLLYIAFPARSPRWSCPELYGPPLAGAFGVYELLTRAWDHVELMQYDAFPSLHTAVSTLSLVYAFRMGKVIWPRHSRTLGLLMLPFVASLQVSTLYLRQHYFVDLMGGWGLAAACCLIAPWVSRSWGLLLHGPHSSTATSTRNSALRARCAIGEPS